MWLLSSIKNFTYHHNLLPGGDYNRAYRNINSIRAPLRKNDCPNNILDSATRILRTRCSHVFKSDSSHDNFLKYKNYRNHTSIICDTDKVEQSMNKDDNHCFSLCFPRFLTDFISNLHLTFQGLLCKNRKNDRLVWDGSFLVDERSNV